MQLDLASFVLLLPVIIGAPILTRKGPVVDGLIGDLGIIVNEVGATIDDVLGGSS